MRFLRNLKDNWLPSSYFPYSVLFFWTALLVRCTLRSPIASYPVQYLYEEVLMYPCLNKYTFISCVNKTQTLMSNFLLSINNGFSKYFWTTNEVTTCFVGWLYYLIRKLLDFLIYGLEECYGDTFSLLGDYPVIYALMRF